MDKKQRMFLYITIISAAILTALAVFFGAYCHVRSLSKHGLRIETQKLIEDNKALETRKEFMQSDVNSKTDNTEQKDSLNKLITDTTEKLNKAKSELSSLKSELSSVNDSAKKIKNEYNTLKKGMNPVKGAYKNAENARLMCPAELAVGRYIATGDGIITVISVTGEARISESLHELDTSSYTFDIAAGEELQTRGSVTITQLK